MYIAEAEQAKFEHVIDLMRAHENAEQSSLLNMQLVTEPDCQVSMETLTQGIENQGSFSSKKMQKIINTYKKMQQIYKHMLLKNKKHIKTY